MCIITRKTLEVVCMFTIIFLAEGQEIFALVMIASVLCVVLEQVKCCLKYTQHGSLLRRKVKLRVDTVRIWLGELASRLTFLFGKCITQLSIHLLRLQHADCTDLWF